MFNCNKYFWINKGKKFNFSFKRKVNYLKYTLFLNFSIYIYLLYLFKFI